MQTLYWLAPFVGVGVAARAAGVSKPSSKQSPFEGTHAGSSRSVRDPPRPARGPRLPKSPTLSGRTSWANLSVFGPAFRLPQPQRYVLWLHRLPHRREQFGVQSVHVSLVAQLRGECFQRFSGVILAAIEAVIDQVLNTTPQGLNSAAFKRVDATIASCDPLPVSPRKTYCKTTTPPT